MGQMDSAKGTQQFGCRLGDGWTQAQAKSLAHLAVSWGTQTSPHWRRQQKHHQCVRKVLLLWQQCSETPKRIKCHGHSRYPLKGSTEVSGDVWFTQWTQSHSHCCRQLVLHPKQSVILYPTLHRDNSEFELLSPCAVTLLFIHIFTAACIFDLGQSQGATEGKEYLLANWDLFASFDFPLCPGEGKKGHILVSLQVTTMKHAEVLCS